MNCTKDSLAATEGRRERHASEVVSLSPRGQPADGELLKLHQEKSDEKSANSSLIVPIQLVPNRRQTHEVQRQLLQQRAAPDPQINAASITQSYLSQNYVF